MTTSATSFILDSDPTKDTDLESRLLALCRDAGFAESVAGEFTTAIVEAVNNSKEHAYQGESGHPIRLHWDCADDRVQVEIRDRGQPLPGDPLNDATMPAPDALSGRGWAIIRAWTDAASYARDGDENVLNLMRRR